MIVANPKKLSMLCRILEEAFTEAKGYGSQLCDADDQATKTRLARLILAAYTEGETQPRLLKRIALMRLARGDSLIPH